MPSKREGTGGIRSVERVVSILRTLAGRSELSLSEVSTLTGLDKSTTYRFLTALEEPGFVARDPFTKLYRLGFGLAELGGLVVSGIEVRRVASPHLSRLHSHCGETIHLGVVDDGEAVYVDKLENQDRSVRLTSHIGKRVPLHCTGLGKALLAYLDESEITEVIERRGLTRCTPRTITSPGDLREHCAMIRHHGYAIDDREHNELARAVGAPIFDRDGLSIAAVSLTAVGVEVDSYRFREFVDLVRQTAEQISRDLGYRGMREPRAAHAG